MRTINLLITLCIFPYIKYQRHFHKTWKIIDNGFWINLFRHRSFSWMKQTKKKSKKELMNVEEEKNAFDVRLTGACFSSPSDISRLVAASDNQKAKMCGDAFSVLFHFNSISVCWYLSWALQKEMVHYQAQWNETRCCAHFSVDNDFIFYFDVSLMTLCLYVLLELLLDFRWKKRYRRVTLSKPPDR